MKRLFFVLALCLAGCSPQPLPVDPIAEAKTRALQRELSELVERRTTGLRVIENWDESQIQATGEKNYKSSKICMKTYIVFSEKQFEVQARIVELDKLLGTDSRSKHPASENQEKIEELEQLVANSEKALAISRATLQEVVAPNSSKKELDGYEVLIKYRETKLRLWKLQLDLLRRG